MLSRIRLSAFILAAILIAVLSIVLPLLAQIPSSASPQLRFRESDQTLPAGLWRLRLQGDTFTLEQNTAAAGNFSTLITPISITPTSGLISFLGGLRTSSGTATAPSYSFTTDTNTGMFALPPDILAFSVGGVDRMRLQSSGLDMQNNPILNIGNAGTDFTSGGTLLLAGNLISINDVAAGAAKFLEWTGRSRLSSSADGIITISNNAVTDFTRLTFGSTNAAFPALGRVGSGLRVHLADGTAGGSILIGNLTDADVDAANTATPHVMGIGTIGEGAAFVRFGTSTLGPGIRLFKTRSTTGGDANTIVQLDDELGWIGAVGADGATYVQGAAIGFFVDDIPGLNDMPGRIDFFVTPNGSPTQAVAWRIRNNKDLQPATQGGASIGAPGFEPNILFTVNGFRLAGTGLADLGAAGSGLKRIYADFTNTAPGTIGAQTINKMSGRVNIAASGTSVVVTNSLVTAASQVFVIPVTNDSTARVTSVVPGAGSFTINTVATTAETAFAFFVLNN